MVIALFMATTFFIHGPRMKSSALNELKKNLRDAPAPAPVKKISPVVTAPAEEIDEAELFARATRGARRIHSSAVPTPRAAITLKPALDANTLRRRAAVMADENTSGTPISDTAALMNAVAPEEFLSFARSGVQARALQKLKQGLSPWQAAVDLHGCTIDDARNAVISLLTNAQKEGLYTVKIVHGKGLQNGQPLIKTCVNGWLRQLPQVLAFVSCTARDGGTGAVYVLLKKTRKSEDESGA